MPFLLKYSSGSLGWGSRSCGSGGAVLTSLLEMRGLSEHGASSHRDALEGALGCQRDAEFNSEAQQKSQEERKTEATWQVLLRSREAALTDVERQIFHTIPSTDDFFFSSLARDD